MTDSSGGSGQADTTTDVLVVGAGPTGLLLAGDLASAGVAVTLVERRTPEISNMTRAFGVHARTLELLDARGLADELVKTGIPVTRLRLFSRLTLDLSGLRTRFPYLLITPQYEVERLLERRAEGSGVRFEYGTEMLGLRRGNGRVEVETRTEDGSVYMHRARYVVGADGVRSSVRHALDLPFPGVSVIKSIVLADVRLAEEPEAVLTVNGTGDAFAFVAPFGGGWYRVMGWDRRRQLPDSAPVDLDEVREIARTALGTDLGMHRARWISRFHSDERQVPEYRVGRVLLAGDAAHVHSPAGGQGMNTGLQDAANLGWKLAAVVRGRAPESLLDTYHAERHPVGRAVLRSSGAIVRLAMARGPVRRAARTVLARVTGAVSPLNGRLTGMLTGLGIAYEAGPGAHALAGKRAPDLHLAADGGPGPVRLYEALRGGRFVLVVPGDEGADTGGREDRVTVVHWAGGRRTALLVRPDGHVAWASDETGPALRAAALSEALTRWTGTP